MSHNDIYKEHYFFELGRRDALNGSLSFPVGLITLLSGALFLIFEKLSAPLSNLEYALVALLILCAIALVASAVFLIRAYWGYSYRYMPLSSDLLSFRMQLERYFAGLGYSGPELKEKTEEQFNLELDTTYAENCRINSLNNDSKSSNLFKANSLIVGAIALAIASVPLFAVHSYLTPQQSHQVEVVNLKELHMRQQRQNNQQPAQPQPQQPAQPKMPPSRDVKEHVDPLKKK